MPALDGLRAIAVLLVLWAHIPQNFFGSVGVSLSYALQPGYLGVDIFFILSGFLITRILIYDKWKRQPLRIFFLKRALRIFPIYYLTIIILAFVHSGSYLIWCATYLSNFTFSYNLDPNPMRHSWSLCVEEHFYLIWPLIVYWVPKKYLAKTAWIMAIGGFALSFFAVLIKDYSSLYMMTYRGTMFRVASLSIGALFAIYEPQIRRNPKIIQTMIFYSLLSGCTFAVIGAWMKSIAPEWVPPCKHIGFGLIASTFFLCSLYVNDKEWRINKLLSTGILPFLGMISYGIYLYHYPIYYFFGMISHLPSHSNPTALNVLAATSITILVATFSFFLIEKPILKIKDRLK